MKRRCTIIILLLVLCLTLSGCAEIPVDFAEFDPTQVVSVQLYHEWVNCYASTSGIFLELSPIAELDTTHLEDFVKDLSMLHFTDFLIFLPVSYHPSSDMGQWIVRVNFTDGSYWAISSSGCNEYYTAEHENTDGNHFDVSTEQWEWLIRTYFPLDFADITDKTAAEPQIA